MTEEGLSGWIANDVINRVIAYKNYIPKGFQLLENHPPKSRSDTFRFLIEVFEEEEKMIQAEHEKSYVTDDYENGVRKFAVSLMDVLLHRHDWMKANKKYKELCGNRHIAYAYYHTINAEGYDGPIISDLAYQKILYLGLVEFYHKFYGNFSDNEEAIELLCKYYPQELDSELETSVSEIASALYPHVSNAGTPNDIGYSYQGINLIKKYIGYLPKRVVETLLKEYELYPILNHTVSRHQIFALIEYSNFPKDKKRYLKFWYLDSLMIANEINHSLKKQLEEEGMEPSLHHHNSNHKLSNHLLIVFDKPFTFWNRASTKDMVLYMDGEDLFKIILLDNWVTIRHLKSDRSLSFLFHDKEWMLETYTDAHTRNQIQKLFMETDSKGEEFHGSMIFSLAYLDNYRGLQNQVIDFDHKFVFDRFHTLSERQSDNAKRIPHIYGKSVYSLSCIVGKNATGKTSVMDFLRETFFKLLKLIEEKKLSCEEGQVKEEEYKDYHLLDENAKFLVVFSLDETTYFLTNLEGIKGKGIEPFRHGIYKNIRELSKAAYFSSQLRADQRELLLDQPQEAVYNKTKKEKQRLSKINDGFRQVDYSETNSFIRKRKSIQLLQANIDISKGFNREICYELSFLKKCGIEKLCDYFDITEETEFFLASQLSEEKKKTFRLKDLEKETSIMEELEKFVLLPDSIMGHFSAGQYAKFSFLSKLRWFLEGDIEEMGRYNKLAGETIFSREEVLLEGETALIFIDEGEIYYHPEWQRGYIKDLLEMVNSLKRNVQIVVTTNSPFFISDIQNEDITYLPEGEGESEAKKREGTLGQNIHKLLKDNFFMNYTIGEYARNLIENIMNCLQNNNPEELLNIYFDETENDYDALHLLIQQIGEPIYRYQLKKMLEESDFVKQRSAEKQINELEEEKRKLQEEINKLKGME